MVGTERAQLSAQAQAVLFRGLTTFLEAGFPVERAVLAVSRSARRVEAEILTEALERLRGGASVATALEQTGAFSRSAIGLLRAGERAGGIAGALAMAADEIEWQSEFSRSVRSALVYPALLLVTGVVSIGIIVGVVIPRFAVILADLGQTLPGPTRLLMDVSSLVQRGGVLWLILPSLIVLALGWWREREDGRRRIDEAFLRLPAIGAIRHAMASARFSRNLGALLQIGVPVLRALEGAGHSMADSAMLLRVSSAQRLVAEGIPLSRALQQSRLLTPRLEQLVAMGEGTGRLPAMLQRGGEVEAVDARNRTAVMVRLIEPIMILMFASLVAFVAAAMLQAVYSVRPGT